jgi:predicted ATPase/DNA-binding SARP family transcriptional activator
LRRLVLLGLVGAAFNVLGRLEVYVDGVDSTPAAPKERNLLALLVVNSGRMVSTDHLLDELWPGLAPDRARPSLHVRIAGIRKALGRAPGAEALLQSSGPGYRLDVPPDAVDAEQFRRLAREGRSRRDEGDPAGAAEALASALTLWRGEPLSDAHDSVELEAIAARLTEERLDAAEDWADAELACGHHHVVLADVSSLAETHPWRERLWRQRMICLYQAGRQADALAVGQELRHRLVDELGLDPSPELAQLERAILDHDGDLLSPRPVAPTSSRRAADHSISLVARSWRRRSPPSSLIARDELIANIADQIGPAVLVTLVGAGGVGKTRLAAAVADRIAPSHREEVAWIDLTTLSEPSAIVHELAGLLGVRASRGEDLTDKVATAIGDRDVVVVFDNCEHLLDAMRPLTRVLLERCTGLAVLATSREPLGLTSERTVWVGPLSTSGVDSPAVDLLVERLGIERAELDGAELAMLSEIAARLDGIPLALELVAARCRKLGIIAVGRRLPGHLGRLSDPRRPARHQTLDATIDWSYAALGPAEQALLRSLAAFSGWFDLDAVEAVAGDESADVESIVASLVEKSLLEHDGHRFRLLELTKEFAAHRLSEAGERDAVDTALTRYVRSRVVAIREGLHGRDEGTWVELLDLLWPDVRAVVRRGLDDDDADTVIELVTHLAFEAFWRRPEALAWIEEAARRWGDRPGARRHELLGAAAMAAWTHVDIPEAMRLASAALAADPNPGTALDCLPECGAMGALFYAGQLEEGLAVNRRAVSRLSTGGDRWTLAVVLGIVPIGLAVTGRGAGNDEFEQAAKEAITVAHSIGNPTAVAYAYYTFALGLRPEPPRALAALETARAYASEVHNRWLLTNSAFLVAVSVLDAELDEAALATLLDAAEDLHRTGWSAQAWATMWSAVASLFDLGRPDAAAMVLGGCESSGVSRLADQDVPGELDDDSSPTASYRQLGRHLPFDDLLAIAAGRRPLPLLP